MGWFGELWRRFLVLFQRDKMAKDLADEIRLHLDLRAEEQAAAGLQPREAEARARRAFGNVTQLSEQGRAVWGWVFLETLANDLRYGVRALRSDPGFAIAAVGSLALGIGANTAIFSILNAVMLRSLPVEDPQQLVQLESRENGHFEGGYTNPIWEQVRDHQQAFRGVLAYSSNRFDLANGGESHFAYGIWVSGDFFRVLGVPAIQGRLITPRDDRHGCGPDGPVAVISYGFWKGRFASDPNIIGKAFTIDRHPFQIIGVTPAWFTGLDTDRAYDFAIPIGCEPLLHTDQSALGQRSWWWLQIVGRLQPGETLQGGPSPYERHRTGGLPGDHSDKLVFRYAEAVPAHYVSTAAGGHRLLRYEDPLSHRALYLNGGCWSGSLDCLRQRGKSASRPRGRASA
jgi:hypothetical protein